MSWASQYHADPPQAAELPAFLATGGVDTLVRMQTHARLAFSMQSVGSWGWGSACARTHTHMHSHTRSHIHMHLHTHAHAHTNVHTDVHAHTGMHMCTHTRTCMHIHAHAHRCADAHMHTPAHAHIRAHTYRHMHTRHVLTHTHARTRTRKDSSEIGNDRVDQYHPQSSLLWEKLILPNKHCVFKKNKTKQNRVCE